MGLPPRQFNPNTPIPNYTFESPQIYTLDGASGPTVVGSGLYVDYENLSINSGSTVTGIIAGLGISVSSSVGNVAISNMGVLSLTAGSGISISGSTGNITISAIGAGSGTVTSVGTGTGLTGGTITTSGVIALADTTVNAGSYTNANITVDPQGRITAASNGSSSSGTVTSITVTAPLTGGTFTTTGTIGLATSGVGAGSYTLANVTVDAFGRITAASNGSVSGFIPCSCITGKGALITGTAASTPVGLTVGTDGQVLFACTAATSGLCWSGIPVATPQIFGTVYGQTNFANTFLGQQAGVGLQGFTGGCAVTAIGYQAGAALGVSSDSSTIIGSGALRNSTCSRYVTALGDRAMCNAGNTIENVAVGTLALRPVTGSYNTALGSLAGYSMVAGASNVLIGRNAACANTSGNRNVVIGADVTTSSLTTSCELVIGYNAGQNWITGNSTKAIKPGAGIIDKNNSCGTAGQVLMSDGANAICWGAAGGSVPSATPTVEGVVLGCTNAINAALGCNALLANTTGSNNVATGISALAGNTSGTNNTALGWYALSLTTTTSDNTAVGGQAGSGAIGDENTFIGRESGSGVTGSGNTFLGWAAGKDQLTGDYNLALGYAVDVANLNGSCQLAIGFSATENWLTGDSTKAIKPGAGVIDKNGSCGAAGEVLSSDGANAIEWIAAGGVSATPTVEGILYGCSFGTNTSVGFNALLGNTGFCNTAVGNDALCNANGADENTAVGHWALRDNQTGGSNTAVGQKALISNDGSNNVAMGVNALYTNTTGGCNTAIGLNAGYYNDTGEQNTSVGWRAGVGNDTGCYNTAVGTCSLDSNTGGTGDTALGAHSLSTLAGNYNTAVGYCSGYLQTTGDCNVFIGCGVRVPNLTGDCQLAIGFSATDYWLTGDCNKAIKPGAGIVDCVASCGTANQVLVSTGSNAVQWKSVNSVIAAPIYGSFYDTTPSVPLVTPGVGQPVALGSTAGANGISVLNGSEIHFTVAGTYNVQFSLQFEDSNASADIIEVWVAKGGTAIPESNSKITSSGAGKADLLAVNIVGTFTATDYIEIYWGSLASSVTLSTLPSGLSNGPNSPNAIVTVVPVGA